MRPPSALLAAVVSAWLSGCAMEPVAVTSKNGGGSQSETAFSINRHGDTARVTIAYNDGTTQSAITYTATTRVATAGATHLGWSHSADFGANWTYGGRVQGNDDWPILWGDPGIGHSVRDQRYVYIVSLAIPKAKQELETLRAKAEAIPRDAARIERFALFLCLSNVNTEVFRFIDKP